MQLESIWFYWKAKAHKFRHLTINWHYKRLDLLIYFWFHESNDSGGVHSLFWFLDTKTGKERLHEFRHVMINSQTKNYLQIELRFHESNASGTVYSLFWSNCLWYKFHILPCLWKIEVQRRPSFIIFHHFQLMKNTIPLYAA